MVQQIPQRWQQAKKAAWRWAVTRMSAQRMPAKPDTRDVAKLKKSTGIDPVQVRKVEKS